MTAPEQRAWLVRLSELRFRVFSGAPVVEVAPAQWGLDPTAIGQAAHSRRYRETPPDQAGFLLKFVKQALNVAAPIEAFQARRPALDAKGGHSGGQRSVDVRPGR